MNHEPERESDSSQYQALTDSPLDWQSMSPARRVGVILVVFALAGTLANVGIIALDPSETRPNYNTGSGAIGVMLWPYLLARLLKWKRAWSYAIFGLLAAFAINIGAGAIRGLENRAQVQAVEARLLAAIEKFEPDTGAQARAAEGNEEAMRKILLPAFARASQFAADAALVGVLDGTIEMIDPKSGLNLPRCVAALMGTPAPNTKREEVEAAAVPMIAVFESAARNRELPPVVDTERAEALLESVRTQADPDGALSDETRLAALTDSEKCTLYLRYLRAMRALPQDSAGLVMRYNVAPAD
jgi:hypothetical protein